MIRVVVTDQDLDVRQHLTTIIDSHRDMQVVATAATADKARAAVTEHRPDVAIVDPHLEGAHGLDLCGQLQAGSPETSCLVHATSVDGHRSGSDSVAAVVLKQLHSDQLIATIRQLAPDAASTAHQPSDRADHP